MNRYIEKEMIQIIEDYLELLDLEGVWAFLEEINFDNRFKRTIKYYFTLGVFMSRLFDDDLDALANELISEGWHKWSGLDKWNKYQARGQRDLKAFGKYSDIMSIYEALLTYFGGVPLSDNIKELTENVAKLDIYKYREMIDFTCRSNSYGALEEYSLSCPIINGRTHVGMIDPKMIDTLYVAKTSRLMEDIIDDPHWSFGFSMKSTEQYYYTEDCVIYVPLNKYLELNEEAMYISTALPKEILEKYSLPISEEVV